MKYQPHSGTSRLAALRIEPAARTLRAAVYSVIIKAGVSGATDEEICEALRMAGNTERPRRVELMDGGFVKDSSRRRHTRSGRQAVVWIAVRKVSG
jgi:transcription initiation factor IIE alpha subunit